MPRAWELFDVVTIHSVPLLDAGSGQAKPRQFNEMMACIRTATLLRRPWPPVDRADQACSMSCIAPGRMRMPWQRVQVHRV